MKPSRPKKVVSIVETQDQAGLWGFLLRHLNTISTVLLLALAVFMFVRWRMKTAENAKILIGNDLTTAQRQVAILRSGGQMPGAPQPSPADLIKAIQAAQTQASGAISNVVNSTDADDRMRAQAFVVRGDMYWYLANLPPLPGSESETSLRLSESSDSYLQKASDSYQQVLKDPAFSKQYEAIDAAHLALAAVAENRGDWTAAQKELEAVKGDPNAITALADAAKRQLEDLPDLQKAVYVLPPSGMATSQPMAGIRTDLPLGAYPGATTQMLKQLGALLATQPSTQPTVPGANQLRSLLSGEPTTATIPTTKPALAVPATQPAQR